MKLEGIPQELDVAHDHVADVKFMLDKETTNNIKDIVTTIAAGAVVVVVAQAIGKLGVDTSHNVWRYVHEAHYAKLYPRSWMN